MNLIRTIIALSPVILCQPVLAEIPVQAYGVTVVGAPGGTCIGSTGLRCTNLSSHPYILLGGYYMAGDGGGGYFAKGNFGCTDNGGTILQDSVGTCFYRTDERTAIPVEWFGAHCDAVSTVYGGSLTAGSTLFTPTGLSFQSGDVGKVIEFFGASGNPFRTKIDSVSGGTATLHTAAYNNYPGAVGAKDASFVPIIEDGLDSPGSGYSPGDVLTVVGGGGSPAAVSVKATGLVNFNMTSGGTNYRTGDLITINLATSGTIIAPPQIQVTAITAGGVVGTYVWVNYGKYSGSNPTGFTSTTTNGTGSGFTISLVSSSFGVTSVKLTANGSYTSVPALPAPTNYGGTGTGATIDLKFPTPYWVFGHDDSTAFQNVETFLENDTNRGVYNAAEVPGGQTCLLQTLQINRAVTWRSSGSRQANLMQLIGAPSSSVDNVRYGFILVAANYPTYDTYQDSSIGQTAVGLNNITILGGTSSQTVDTDTGSGQTYTNDGLLFQNPTGSAHTNVNAAMQNLQVASFGGNALSANRFSGEFRAYNIYAGNAGMNCLDIEHVANPTRFYGLVASGCTAASGPSVSGINIVSSKTQEFHGASVFGNDIDVSVTGTRGNPNSYVVFDNLQLGHTKYENMYLDQQNETVICVENCTFKDMNQSDATTGDSDSAIVIGPDANNSFGGTTSILRLNQGLIDPSDNIHDSNYLDIRFEVPSGASTTCKCSVALGDGMVDLPNGFVSNNSASTTTASVSGPIFFGGPQVGPNVDLGAPPISLSSAEIGMGVTTTTITAPGVGGLKLSVQCHTPHNGKVKLVVLAGSDSSGTTLVDNIGSLGDVTACQ